MGASRCRKLSSPLSARPNASPSHERIYGRHQSGTRRRALSAYQSARRTSRRAPLPRIAAYSPPWIRLAEMIVRLAPASGLSWGLRCRCANDRRVAVGLAGQCRNFSQTAFSLPHLKSWRASSTFSQFHARPEVLRNGGNCRADAVLQFSPLRRVNRVRYNAGTSRRCDRHGELGSFPFKKSQSISRSHGSFPAILYAGSKRARHR